MADSCIVNELLAFTFHKYNSDTHAAIQNTLLTFYCDDDISEAKTMLHHHYEDVIGVRPARQNRGTKSIKEKDVTDILDAIKKLDETNTVRNVKFVALNLSNLPPLMTMASDSDNDNLCIRLSLLEAQMLKFISTRSTSAMATVPPSLERHAPPAPPMSRRHQRTQRSGDPLPFVDHDRQADVPPHPVSTPIQPTSTAPSSSSTGAWHTVKRTKPKIATYGIRKDNTSVFKANPRRHEFVVFNIPRGTEVDIVKQYIASNNVDVMDIVRLSKDDWSNQYFRVCVSYDHIEKVKVSDFWPENIGYRPFYRNRNSNNKDDGK